MYVTNFDAEPQSAGCTTSHTTTLGVFWPDTNVNDPVQEAEVLCAPGLLLLT